MASSHFTKAGFFAAVAFFCITCVNARIECEDLSAETCAYAVSSSGARCVLEKYATEDESPRYECQTSKIMAEKAVAFVETEACLKSCGLQKRSVGLSTDALLERETTNKLCSLQCQKNCPNIVDLYTNLAAGEGLHLQHICDARKLHSRRLIATNLGIFSALGFAAEAPEPQTDYLPSPASAPVVETPVPSSQPTTVNGTWTSYLPSPSSSPEYELLAPSFQPNYNDRLPVPVNEFPFPPSQPDVSNKTWTSPSSGNNGSMGAILSS